MITDIFLDQKRVNVCEYTWRHLHYLFTYIYSLLNEKDICDRQNVSIKLPCVCVCLSCRDLFLFSVRISSFFSYFLFMEYNFCNSLFFACSWRWECSWNSMETYGTVQGSNIITGLAKGIHGKPWRENVNHDCHSRMSILEQNRNAILRNDFLHNVLHCICFDGVVITAQCTATFSDLLCSSKFRYY